MKMLSSEITKLLDKLYNLRGDDSVILSKMEKERELAEETKERTLKEKESLQDKIETLDKEESILESEGENLVSTLSRIKSDDFKTVLNKLNVDFNPEKISEEVANRLPQTIERVHKDIENSKEELVKVEKEMNTAITTIEELAIRKDEALANQARLNEYFDLALNGNINITRDSITSLLEKFDFSTDEQREAAKILMFPEDALFAYEERIKNGIQSGKTISEVFAEAKENNHEDESKSPKDDLVNILSSIGFDYLDFTNNDIEKILANYNESLLKKNVEFAKEKGLKLDMFVDNVELLYDSEFDSKVNKLIEIGKEPFDIYLNPSILVKYKKDDLDSTIDKIKSSGLDPKIVPLIAY